MSDDKRFDDIDRRSGYPDRQPNKWGLRCAAVRWVLFWLAVAVVVTWAMPTFTPTPDTPGLRPFGEVPYSATYDAP